MAPTPPLLNAACVALGTVDYLAKCSFIPPPPKDHPAGWKIFLIVSCTVIGVALTISFTEGITKRFLLEELWRMLTEKLYEEVDRRFVKSLDSKSQKCQSNFKGRG
jgi:hypothetical protein